jgi:hypothetical protein
VEVRGRRRQHPRSKAAFTSLCRVLALRFQAGAIVLFIRWRTIGTRSAQSIRASGHPRRINRPDT